MPGTAGGTVRSSALTVSSATRFVSAAGPLAPAGHPQSDDDLTIKTLPDQENLFGNKPGAPCNLLRALPGSCNRMHSPNQRVFGARMSAEITADDALHVNEGSPARATP